MKPNEVCFLKMIINPPRKDLNKLKIDMKKTTLKTKKIDFDKINNFFLFSHLINKIHKNILAPRTPW